MSQAVVMGEKVYIGGGLDETSGGAQVFQYDPSLDKWSSLPPNNVTWFAMVEFMGNLITVGGLIHNETAVTGDVYCFNEQSQKWEEFLKPMLSARYYHSAATTQSAVVTSGGFTVKDDVPLPSATVEVYSSETSQWHTADPLPVPCWVMTSVTIADTWYQLGGNGPQNGMSTVLYAPLTALIQKATSPTQQSASHMSVWKTLPDTPLLGSAAASLSGNLVAVGGYDDISVSPAVYNFLPDTNSWVRVTGDLPEPRYNCTAVLLSTNQVLVAAGYGVKYGPETKTVFLGSSTS